MAKRSKEALKNFSPSTALEMLDYFVTQNQIKIEFLPRHGRLRLRAGPIPLDQFDVLFPILEKCVIALGAAHNDIKTNRLWPLMRKDSLYLANATPVAQALQAAGIKFKKSEKVPFATDADSPVAENVTSSAVSTPPAAITITASAENGHAVSSPLPAETASSVNDTQGSELGVTVSTGDTPSSRSWVSTATSNDLMTAAERAQRPRVESSVPLK